MMTDLSAYPTAPMFDLGIQGYLNTGGSEGMFLREPAIGPEEPHGPFRIIMRREFDAMANR
jgi:hypothetical protein